LLLKHGKARSTTRSGGGPGRPVEIWKAV